jgi:anti-sigma factor (TIGR02949 family)
MDCREAEAALDALLDGELTDEARCAVKSHLDECSRCREEYAYRRVLQRTIRQSALDIEVPGRLWETIRTRMDRVDRVQRRRQTHAPRWAMLAGSAGLLALLIGVSLWPWGPHFQTSPFMMESVNNYIRYLLLDAPYDLQTPDADHVRQWFQGRLDFMVEPPDLRAEGYQLQGTRLGYFLDRMVAEIGYEGQQHRLSIFMTKGEGIDRLVGERVSRHGQEFFVTTTKGYTVVAWRDGPETIVCSIVADLSRDQLLRLAFTVAGVPS